MSGSNPFSIEKTDHFKRCFKKLYKSHGDGFLDRVDSILKELIDNPYPLNSQPEPLPGKIKLPDGCTFYKLRFKIGKGNSGQIRLMYLVNQTTFEIIPLWIYNHEQFPKRPPDKDIVSIIIEALDL